jgi:hypothetical protein
VLDVVKDAFRAACGGGLRPSLTTSARDGSQLTGRDEETGAKRIEQRNILQGSALAVRQPMAQNKKSLFAAPAARFFFFRKRSASYPS